MKKLVVTASLALAVSSSWAAGFGIYEASAKGNALGGTLVGEVEDVDATANYYNPAGIAFATNIQFAVGVTFINPYCDVTVNHKRQERMNSGWFTVPTFYLTVPVMDDLSFGFGSYTEYGLGSRYGIDWDLADDTQKTTMRQFTLNPNVAYKLTDWWSVSVGGRASWIQFINHNNPFLGDTYYYDLGGGSYLPIADAYHLNSKLKGEDWGLGYNAATTIKATDDLSFGLVYRSQIRHKIHGHFDLAGSIADTPHIEPQGRAAARLTLPRSVTFGSNYKVSDRWRVGASITWTQWSSVKNIHFNLPNGHSYVQKLGWENVFRFGFGVEHDLLDWLAVRVGYVYDMDPSSKYCGTTMLPAGDRHIIGTGFGFKITDNLSWDIGYSFIRMNNDDRFVDVKVAPGNKPQTKRFSTRNGTSHLVSTSLRYSF